MPWSKNATAEEKSAAYKSYYARNREAQKAKSKARYAAMTKGERKECLEKAKTYNAKYKADGRYEGKYKNRTSKKDPRDKMLQGARKRAKDQGREFKLKHVHIFIPTRCPILGILLKRNNNGPTPSSPSLDRLDSSKGYVPGNVWVISHRANTLKSNATSEELFKVARAVQLIEEKARSIISQ